MNPESFYPLFLKANNVVIDNRKLEKNDIFFAFSGETFNAATLAEQAVENGAIAVIVEQENFAQPEKNIFYVPSTLKFLQDLAVFHREQLTIPIIALTGSNGKTTTKELIHAVLSENFKVQYTKGNLNNHIGVPLTLLSIKADHEIAVVEMGANHQKEISTLCEIAKPDFGYITNFGKAHLEGFGGFEGVIKGKSEMYTYLIQNHKTLLVNQQDEIQVEKTKDYDKKITFGTADSDYYFESFSKEHFVGLKFEEQEALSQLTGNYNFNNLSAAAAFGFHFGISFQQISHAISNYLPTNMRSQIMHKNGKTLVLDTYNANPSSMSESLKNFSTFEGSKTIIIGDMLELGAESEHEHTNILHQAAQLGFDEIITVGKNFKNTNSHCTAYNDVNDLIEHLKNNAIESKNILIKGSRGIALEKAIDFIV